MVQSRTKTLMLLLAYLGIVKAFSLHHRRDLPVAHSAELARRNPSAGSKDSNVDQGATSCWSPCDRFASSRSHLPTYDSAVPGARSRSRISPSKNENAKSKEKELSAKDVRSRQVVLLQTHHRQDFTPELVSHIESLITESAPRRVFILFHCQDVAQDLKVLPLSLRPFAYPYTHADIEAVYFFGEESSKAWDLKFHTDLPAMLFVLSHPWYEFAWVMEDDVRLIENWDAFFSESFQEAEKVQLSERLHQTQKRQRNGANYEKTIEETSSREMTASTKSKNLTSPADLLVFSDVEYSSPAWTWKEHANNIPDHEKRHALLTIRGLSRRLIQAMHAHFLRNVTAYFEMFAPSVAHMSGLTTTFVQQYNVNGSFSCCSSEALKVYNSWLTENGTGCQAPVLFHPVKSRHVSQDLFEKGFYARNCTE